MGGGADSVCWERVGVGGSRVKHKMGAGAVSGAGQQGWAWAGPGWQGGVRWR